MARTTAPSLWLPGFDPNVPETPEPSVEADLFADPPAPKAPVACAIQLAPAAIVADAPMDAEAETPSTAPRASWRVIASAKRDTPHSPWPALQREHLSGLAGAATKFEANVAAIQALQALEAGQRQPDAIERGQLLRFTGWGGLPAAFNLEGTDPVWRRRAGELQALLPAEDYESARASVNNSHYTEVHVIEAMWQAVERFGFTGGRVLEPAAGIGHFLGAMPRALTEHCAVTAVEIDRLSGRLLQALYAPHGADVRIAPFEKVALPENWFDLVIGNVPFGNYPVADMGPKSYARFRIHNYFFGRALDLVRPGG
ncbi:MAG TPA: DEAD/DEAH box helicase, partial [Alicycliphilus sp.]|nr:DEAD/DEAH box helicase [Alicycliphilus sp.]